MCDDDTFDAATEDLSRCLAAIDSGACALSNVLARQPLPQSLKDVDVVAAVTIIRMLTNELLRHLPPRLR